MCPSLPTRDLARLALLIAVCAIAAPVVGCKEGQSPVAQHLSFIELLQQDPSRVAAPPPSGTQVVQLSVGVENGQVHVASEPIPVGGSLRMERALARRRHDPPAFWVLQTGADEELFDYWTPLDPSARIRANMKLDSEQQSHIAHLVRVPEMYVALRLPFYPEGKLFFYAADGAPAGSYRFGKTPASPLSLETCPQVQRIHGNAPPERALNVVVMPSGFSAAELPTFRCAAQLMIDKLMTPAAAARDPSFAPLDRYACSINVYRIDLASPPMTVPEECSGKSCTHATVDWSADQEECRPLESNPGCPERAADSASFLELDLDVDACPESAPVCRVIWPSGEGLQRIWQAAACAPEANVVLVLANSEEWAGGGIEDHHSRLVVTTMRGIESDDTRSGLLAHELGHALGLFDEYSDDSAFVDGGERPSFHEGRNVVKAGDDGRIGDVPWASLCLDGAQQPETCRVRCQKQGGCPHCEEAYGNETDRGPEPLVGLFEGGFYDGCGYYSATTYCRMLDAVDTYYCPACKQYLTRFFEGEDLRMQSCAGDRSGPVTPNCEG